MPAKRAYGMDHELYPWSPRRPPVSLERISALSTDTPPSDTSVIVSLIEQSVAVMLADRTDEARRHRLAPDHRTPLP